MFDLFKNILANLADGIVITKASSEILWANPAYCAMTGYALEQLVGNTPRLLRGPETTGANVEQLWDTLRSTGSYKGRIVNRRADGSLFHASLSLSRIQDGWAGSLFVCTMRDVTLEVELEDRLHSLKLQAEWSRDVTISALASLAEQRDPCTGKHLQRIEAYSKLMAEWLLEHDCTRFPRWARDVETISRCATLHDIGKVGIPDSILMKPGPLTEQEQTIMKEHPRLGAEIIDRVIACQPESSFLRVARDIIAYHHEAWDGSGYPYGTSGDAIPLVAQLTTVADIFDALTSVRPYKPAFRYADAVDWIRKQRGSALGPLAVDAFVARLDDIARVHAALGEPESDVPIRPSGIPQARLNILTEPPRAAPVSARQEPVLSALQEALASPVGGEVVVRAGERCGRIYVYRGGIAWVHVSSSDEVLPDVLRQEPGVSSQELASVIDECKRSGLNFAETLVLVGVISRPRLRELMRGFLSRRLRELLELPEPLAMFLPQPRSYTEDWSFSLGELISSEGGDAVPLASVG